MLSVEWLILFVIVCYILYRYGTKTFDYYSSRGVATCKPLVPFLGNSYSIFWKRTSPLEMIQTFYNKHPDRKLTAVLTFRKPLLMIKDPEAMKQVLVKDFDHFINRSSVVDEEADPIFGKNLVSLADQKWRDMRNILSPTFTASKMKNMFHLIDECGVQLVDYVNKQIATQVKDKHKDGDLIKVEFKDLFTRFANDVIATAAFGIKVDSLSEPENEFYMTGKKIMTFSGKALWIAIMYMIAPWLMKFLRIPMFGKKAGKYYTEIMRKTIKERDEKNIVRPDVIHLMMQNRKETIGENGEKKPGLTEIDMTAQAVIFFFAGFETISTFLGFAIHEIGVNPDVQKRLQDEIDRVIKEDDGKLTYDGIMIKMKYLDAVCNEALRKWPPAALADRRVSKRYKLEGIEGEPELYLEKGDVIWIPIGALHHDPKYFPDPEKFDPERFNNENKSKIEPFTFIPFGMGPRNCIGMRFALMEGKVCLVHILKNFNVEVIPETQIPLQLSKTEMQMRPEKGYWLGLRPRIV